MSEKIASVIVVPDDQKKGYLLLMFFVREIQFISLAQKKKLAGFIITKRQQKSRKKSYW
ncbi:MAG: hypothetical protein V1901_03595 [Patescibacteria group bacterium]|nr:hypothetical protein [Patescibacteria group bacterium]